MSQQGVVVKRIGFRWLPTQSVWSRTWGVESIVWGKIKRDVTPMARFQELRRRVSSGVWGRRAGEAYPRVMHIVKEHINR